MQQQRRGGKIAMTRDELDAYLGSERTCTVATIGLHGPVLVVSALTRYPLGIVKVLCGREPNLRWQLGVEVNRVPQRSVGGKGSAGQRAATTVWRASGRPWAPRLPLQVVDGRDRGEAAHGRVEPQLPARWWRAGILVADEENSRLHPECCTDTGEPMV